MAIEFVCNAPNANRRRSKSAIDVSLPVLFSTMYKIFRWGIDQLYACCRYSDPWNDAKTKNDVRNDEQPIYLNCDAWNVKCTTINFRLKCIPNTPFKNRWVSIKTGGNGFRSCWMGNHNHTQLLLLFWCTIECCHSTAGTMCLVYLIVYVAIEVNLWVYNLIR